MDIYQIKVTLKYSHPHIWRRIQVRGDTKLGKLHDILQIGMGWSDSHLHAFRVGQISYGVPDPYSPDNTKNERNVRLDKIVTIGSTLIYEYDFGDGWEHQLNIEKIVPPEPGAHYPRCLAGKRACPPEDCGGIPGYERMLEILSDPQHEEHEEVCEWLGKQFDPEGFDVEEINERLRGV